MSNLPAETIVTLRLDREITEAVHTLAKREGREPNEQITWLIIEALDRAGLLPTSLRDWLLLRESLLQRFGNKAREIIDAEGWQERIIAETARRLMADDAEWRNGYSKLIGAAPYERGVKMKDRINPLLGRRVRVLLDARTGAQYAVPQPSIFASSSELHPSVAAGESSPTSATQVMRASVASQREPGRSEMPTDHDRQPWLKVKRCSYFQSVLDSMSDARRHAEGDSDVVVRFGLAGRGVQPNYQVEIPSNGEVFPTRGDNHQFDARTPGGRYDPRLISAQTFTRADVEALLRRCREARDG